METRTLSTTTKAYKEGRLQLVEAGLISEAAKTATSRKAPKREDKSGSVVSRRAARRGYFDGEEVDFLEPVEIHSPEKNHDQEKSNE